MSVVGAIELSVGVALLAAWARLVAMSWLLGLGVNLVLTGSPAA